MSTTRKLLPLGVLGAAGLIGLGVLVVPATVPAAVDGKAAVLKRDDNAAELVLVADDGDDDADSGVTGVTGQTRTRTGGTAASRATRDHTRSNATAVSRDRDHSRGDKTRDGTRDGGDRTRDLTPNLTNDRSRSDTRGRH
jgi:hypothetical protein